MSGRVVLVTGGSRGIGRAISVAFARLGCSVAVNYRSDEDSALSTVAAGEAADGRARAFRADVGDESEVERLFAEVEREFGRVDVLVNNAGIVDQTPVEDLELRRWEEIQRSNLTSVFLCTRAALRSMLERGAGTIVNVSSIAGERGGALSGAYAASKAGSIALTRFLGRSLAAKGVRVNAVAPAMTDTDLLDELGRAEMERAILPALPMGRFATPQEVAAAVTFLASPEASYITGICLPVYGGQ